MKFVRQIQILISILALLVLVTITNGCKDNPVEPEEEHAEAEGVVLRLNGVDIVTVFEGVVTGSISVPNGVLSDHIEVYFLDHDEDRFQPDDPDFSLGWAVANTTIADVVHEEEEWEMHIQGKQAGTTTIEVQLLHAGHVDFRTPAITITVTP